MRCLFKMRFAAMAAAAAMALVSCSSEEKKDEPQPEQQKYVPRPAPPLDDLLKTAVESEKVGSSVVGFNCVIGYDESVRAYQRIVDDYPQSDHASTARMKVRELSEITRTVRTWQRRITDLKKQLAKVRGAPARIHPLFQDGIRIRDEAPEQYMKDAVQAVLDEITPDYRAAALADVASATEKAEERWRAGDYRTAASFYANLPPGYSADLPDVAAKLRGMIEDLERRATEKAGEEMNKARRAVDRSQENQAHAILRESSERWRGFGVEKEIVAAERDVWLRILKIRTAQAEGSTRELDLELFKILQKGARILPGDPDFARNIEAHLGEIRTHLDKYLSLVAEFTVTRADYEIRRALMDKYVGWEEKRLK